LIINSGILRKASRSTTKRLIAMMFKGGHFEVELNFDWRSGDPVMSVRPLRKYPKAAGTQ
ncbi:MAG: hypothetical protein VYD01_08810, partial [Pseudomonadota bacterium]|nr:hypothetical protein [Pseudomonadota bacterium]